MLRLGSAGRNAGLAPRGTVLTTAKPARQDLTNKVSLAGKVTVNPVFGLVAPVGGGLGADLGGLTERLLATTGAVAIAAAAWHILALSREPAGLGRMPAESPMPGF